MCNLKEKTCVICGKMFYTNYKTGKYCSDECRTKAEKELKKLSSKRCSEHIKQYQKQYREKNKKRLQEYNKNWRNSNKDFISAYQKQYYTNIQNKIKKWSYSAISRCVSSKTLHTFDILDYTPTQLREHLEKQFRDGMNWSNHGTLWHIDHIKPLCSFNFELPNGEIDYEQVKIANSLENLQPLLIQENLTKGGKY